MTIAFIWKNEKITMSYIPTNYSGFSVVINSETNETIVNEQEPKLYVPKMKHVNSDVRRNKPSRFKQILYKGYY